MATHIDFFSVFILKALVIPFHEKKAKNQICRFGNLYLCIRAGFGFSEKQIGLRFLIQFKILVQFETKILLALLNRWSETQ